MHWREWYLAGNFSISVLGALSFLYLNPGLHSIQAVCVASLEDRVRRFTHSSMLRRHPCPTLPNLRCVISFWHCAESLQAQLVLFLKKYRSLVPDLDMWCKKTTSELHDHGSFLEFWIVSRQYMVSAVSFAMSCAMAGLFPTDCRSVQTYPETGGLEMGGRVFPSHGSMIHWDMSFVFPVFRGSVCCKTFFVYLLRVTQISYYILVGARNGGVQWGGPIFFGVRRWNVKVFSLCDLWKLTMELKTIVFLQSRSLKKKHIYHMI